MKKIVDIELGDVLLEQNQRTRVAIPIIPVLVGKRETLVKASNCDLNEWVPQTYPCLYKNIFYCRARRWTAPRSTGVRT